MAYDKVIDSTQLDADLKVVADAIRSKGGTTEQLAFPSGMASAILAIVAGGGTPSNITVSEIVFDTQISNGSELKNYLATILNTNVTTLILNKKLMSATSTLVDCEGMLVFSMKDSASDIGVLTTNLKCALRNKSNYSSYVAWGASNYDFIVNIGDEYLMIEIGEVN